MSRYLFLICLFVTTAVAAQTEQTSAPADSQQQTKQYATYPHWIRMMDDPHANYFEVQKAYYTYWKDKVSPVRPENEARNIFRSEKEEEAEEDRNRPTEYVYECKRFKFWERYYKDLLDEKGFILPPERIIEEWQKQQESGRGGNK